MKKEKQDQDLRAAFAVMQPQGSADSPTTEALTSLRDGTYSDEEANRLLDNVAGDASAARLVLDAKQFPELDPTAEEQAAIEAFPIRDGWQAMRGQLEHEGVLEPLAPETRQDLGVSASAHDAPRVSWGLIEFGAIAATLLVGFGLGYVWPRGGGRSIVNPTVIELTAGAERAGSAAPRSVRSSPGGVEVVIDVVEYAESDDPFEIRLVPEDPSQREAWILPVEDRRYRGTVRVSWPDTPAPGDYRIELRRGGEVLDQDRIQITD